MFVICVLSVGVQGAVGSLVAVSLHRPLTSLRGVLGGGAAPCPLGTAAALGRVMVVVMVVVVAAVMVVVTGVRVGPFPRGARGGDCVTGVASRASEAPCRWVPAERVRVRVAVFGLAVGRMVFVLVFAGQRPPALL